MVVTISKSRRALDRRSKGNDGGTVEKEGTPQGNRMPDKVHFLPEWIKELRPHAVWALVTLIASALGTVIIRLVAQPNVQMMLVFGIVLVVNSLLIGWLSWRRGTQASRSLTLQIAAADTERRDLLQQIAELRSESASLVQQHQREIDALRKEIDRRIPDDAVEIWNPQEQEVREKWEALNPGGRDVLAFIVRNGPLWPEKIFKYLDSQGYDEKIFRKLQETGLILGLKDTYTAKFELKPYLEKIIPTENKNSSMLDTPGRDEGESPIWNIRKQEAYRQWLQLNAAQRALVTFVLVRGSATAAQIFTFADQEGLSKASEIWAWVKAKTGFLEGDPDVGFRINPELKPYLEQIIAKDRGRAAYS